MGADGGTIPTRKELVGTKVAAETPELDQNPFTVCALSNRPLEFHQLVSDYYGRLYNKQALLEYLLDKAKPRKIPHVKGLKDFINLQPHLVDNHWLCPVSNRDIVNESASTKFACASCGHVMELSCFKGQCPLCSRSAKTPIILNAKGSDLVRQKEHLQEIKKQRKALKNKLKK